jgi:hypothetical protein
MKASCRGVRTSVDRIAGIGGSLAKGERRPLSARRSFETGSRNRFHNSSALTRDWGREHIPAPAGV